MARFGFPAIAIFGFACAAMTADPAGAQQSAAAPAASTASFLNSVAAGNQFEIDSSKLALSRSKSDAVKRFAQRMVDDHTEAAGKFKIAVTEAKLTPPSEKLDAKHQAVFDSLTAANDASFDKLYIDAQYKAHVETVDLFKAYAKGGDNARMKQFANELLPTLQAHLDHVGKMR
jgi:putative membrane protein